MFLKRILGQPPNSGAHGSTKQDGVLNHNTCWLICMVAGSSHAHARLQKGAYFVQFADFLKNSVIYWYNYNVAVDI